MKIIPLIAILALTGCATITADSQQEIFVSTDPAGAQCILSNSNGSWNIAQTPGSVTVPRAFESLGVTCTLPGLQPVSAVLEAKTRGRAYGNILLLGLPVVVDAATGAGYEYDPASVTLNFTQ
jgi:hypothetical protein